MSSKSSLFVCKIASSTDMRSLVEHFTQIGRVQRVEYTQDKGHAFVSYERMEDAAKAINKLNDIEMNGNRLIIRYNNDYNQKSVNVGVKIKANNECRLVIKGLSNRTSWSNLKDWARKIGPVKFSNVRLTDDESAHEGIVEFVNAEDVSKAIKELDGTTIKGHIVKLLSLVEVDKDNTLIYNNPTCTTGEQVDLRDTCYSATVDENKGTSNRTKSKDYDRPIKRRMDARSMSPFTGHKDSELYSTLAGKSRYRGNDSIRLQLESPLTGSTNSSHSSGDTNLYGILSTHKVNGSPSTVTNRSTTISRKMSRYESPSCETHVSRSPTARAYKHSTSSRMRNRSTSPSHQIDRSRSPQDRADRSLLYESRRRDRSLSPSHKADTDNYSVDSQYLRYDDQMYEYYDSVKWLLNHHN